MKKSTRKRLLYKLYFMSWFMGPWFIRFYWQPPLSFLIAWTVLGAIGLWFLYSWSQEPKQPRNA